MKIMHPNDSRALWAAAQSSPTGPPCSHCRKPMNVAYSSSGDSELDICKRCRIVWLDTGEWEDIERNRSADKSTASYRSEEAVTYGRLLLQIDKENQTSSKSYAMDNVEVRQIGLTKAMISLLGLPVEEKEDSFAEVPWITMLTIFLIVTVSIWGFSNMEQAIENFAFSSERSFFAKIGTSISSFFIHGGIFHLLSNLYFLWIFGDNVEDHIGKQKYFWLLLLSTVGGNIAYGWFHPDGTPTVGASGGISGVMAYYLWRFPHRRFVMTLFTYITGLARVAIPGVILGLIFLLKEVFGAMAETEAKGGGVAHLAHLGGAVVGIIFAIAFSQKEKSSMNKD